MFKLLFTFWAINISLLASAQRPNLDSLLAISEKSIQNDSIKTKHFIKIFVAYNKIPDFNKVAEYGQKALDASKNLKNSNIYLNVYERLGMCYHGNSKFLEAEKLYLKGIEQAQERKNKPKEANFYLNLSALYSTISDYPKALGSAEKAMNLYKQEVLMDDMNSCYMNIGNIYLYLNQPLKAIEYIKKANQAFVLSEKGINYGVYSANLNLAEAYTKCDKDEQQQLNISHEQQLQLAFKHLETALKVAFGMKDDGLIGTVYMQKAELYDQINDEKNALINYNLALEIAEKRNIDENLSDLYLSLGLHHLKNQNYSESKSFLTKSLTLSKKIKLLENQKEALEKMNIVEERLGNYQAALERHREFVAVKDQIIDQEKEKEITRKQLKLDFEIKEEEYKSMQEFDKKIQWILGISASVLLVLAVLVYRNQQKTKKLNDVISKQKVELEQLGIVKDKMFSLVSHDMRTPVNALISFITLLENRQISQEKLGLYAGELKNQLTSTTNLMENMLSWAASQMQGYKPILQPQNLFLVINLVIENIRNQAEVKGIVINNRISESSTALVDTDMLSLIVRNLLANAIKFSPKNGKIEVSAFEENNTVKVAIKDNGKGMQTEKLQQINDPKNQLIESSMGTQNEKGTGMGLMLSKTFAKLINGRLTAESTENEGSVFILELQKA
jgi:signal transduction histidine kinase